MRLSRYIYKNIIILIILLGFSCQQNKISTLQKIRNDKTIRVGFADEVPFGYIDAEGRITGVSPEIARIVLAKMGVNKIEGVYTEFGQLINNLNLGKFDMIAAGMFITPERSNLIVFSVPIYCDSQAFLVKKGNPGNLHSYEDIKESEDIILVLIEGSIEVNYARRTGIPDSQILCVPDQTLSVFAVKNGLADVFAYTNLVIKYLVKSDMTGEIEKAEPFYSPAVIGESLTSCGAFGFRKEDRELLNEFNKYLDEFINTEEYLDTMKLFGIGKTELPGEPALIENTINNVRTGHEEK